jgi:acetolactate synthase regulatory subunit
VSLVEKFPDPGGEVHLAAGVAAAPATSALRAHRARRVQGPQERLLLAAPASTLRIRYPDGHGILRQILNETTQRGFTIEDLSTEAAGDATRRYGAGDQPAMVAVTMHVHGKRPVSELAAALADLDLVDAVVASDSQSAAE